MKNRRKWTAGIAPMVESCRELVRAYDALQEHDDHAGRFFCMVALTNLRQEVDKLIATELAP